MSNDPPSFRPVRPGAATLTDSMSMELAREGLPQASLKIVHSEDSRLVGTKLALSPEILVIGRDVDQGLAIADSKLSRTHLRVSLEPRSGVHWLGDAGSRNGTFLNGRPIDSAPLPHGAVIRAGNTLLVYMARSEMAVALERADQIASSNLSVLILGETGVGKEVLARRIHERSGRSGQFVGVNCAALPREIVAAELFGHRRGAFSGANQARDGLFLTANGGTLLLDEVGDCPAEVQPALLRALQERTIRPLGSDREQPIDVRMIAATLADLSKDADSGRFRADLYARLAEVVLVIPPLRERRDEILDLYHHFLRESGTQLTLSTSAAEALLSWRWPFNVRELKALVQSLLALGQSARELDLSALRSARPEIASFIEESRRDSQPARPSSAPARSEIADLERLLEQHGGNVSHVAEALGKPRSHVYRWLKNLGLSPERYRRRDG